MNADDMELRLVDPAKNRYRLYGLTVCRTLFGEWCLRIVWGRIGHRRLRERSEMFRDENALERRRRELLLRRQRRGYVTNAATGVTSPRSRTRRRESKEAQARLPLHSCASTARDIVESHGLSLEDARARELVSAWMRATRALAQFAARRDAAGSHESGKPLDLVDASTLASLYLVASAA